MDRVTVDLLDDDYTKARRSAPPLGGELTRLGAAALHDVNWTRAR